MGKEIQGQKSGYLGPAQRSGKLTPTARTLKELRKHGYLAGVVERYNRFSKRSNDLFGFMDIVAVGEGSILGLQVTSGSNVANRVAKITGETREAAIRWLGASGVIQVWGWRKLKAGWLPRIVGITFSGKEFQTEEMAWRDA